MNKLQSGPYAEQHLESSKKNKNLKSSDESEKAKNKRRSSLNPNFN